MRWIVLLTLFHAPTTGAAPSEARPDAVDRLPERPACPPNRFLVKFLDEKDRTRFVVTKSFGHNARTTLRFVDAEVALAEVRHLLVGNPTSRAEIASWPAHFSKAGREIPQLRVAVTSADGTQKTYRMWATLWFYFTDESTGESFGVHTGRVLEVWHRK